MLTPGARAAHRAALHLGHASAQTYPGHVYPMSEYGPSEPTFSRKYCAVKKTVPEIVF